MTTKPLSFRPYARLLTMLGEQLIKNEQIALVELIKNSYDADADGVEVRFENFDDGVHSKNSSIVVKDDGSGMTPEDIRDVWMNPAAPQKFRRKKEGKSKTPEKRRTIQGEKGIGRFAILKLGRKVTVTTKSKGSKFESIIEYDFTRFDDDFTEEDGHSKTIFLDEILITYNERDPKVFKGSHGTHIEISDLRGSWSEDMVKKLRDNVSSLTDPISRISQKDTEDPFQISIFYNGEIKPLSEENADELRGLIEDKAVFKIQGEFNADGKFFSFAVQQEESSEQKISLTDSKIRGLWLWNKRLKETEGRDYECGDFKFHFYIFDFSPKASGKYYLLRSQKNILKDHRVYLYRDNVRVYPYGDPNDDWLNIDVHRGIGKVGDFFSNDQMVGWVDITQEKNPDLRDKTNREGLIEKGNAVDDFVGLIQVFLSYIKRYPYSRYQQSTKDKQITDIVRSEIVTNKLSELEANLKEKRDSSNVKAVRKIKKTYTAERDYLIQRAETTEDLAGVGLSVEMTSHDIMLMMGRAEDVGKEIARLSRQAGDEKIQERSNILIVILSQIVDGMQDVQTLFKSSKRRRKNLRVEPVLDKIHQLYESLLEKRNIHYIKEGFKGSPLVADTTDGVIMQVLINLFDNSAYWLDTVSGRKKEIKVVGNGEQGEMIFADNGPGIDKEDVPYIFEPFYSGKGQEGRGLGLYIARQLLERHDYSISVIEREKDKLLPGANFVVSFFKEDD